MTAINVEQVYRGEIRESEIGGLLEKVQQKNYGKYLLRIRLDPVRGFSDQRVTFDFPVTALVGPNGGGKTTILGAAACAYIKIKPRQFFAKSGPLDKSMQNWSIKYELIDRGLSPKDTILRTASFKSSKWSRDALGREVTVFGVSRTVPANERRELAKFGAITYDFSGKQTKALAAPVAKAVSTILGKDVTSYSEISIDSKGRVSLLTGKTENGVEFSEFHFGAGESSVIRMVMQIETMPENSLILIEEIENGLHPVATQRMVEYLIDVAIRKKAQAIFTTHSNDALLPLPSKAIWTAISNDKVFQGKLDINSLRAIKGQVDAQLVIFTEDDFATEWIKSVLRYTDTPLDMIQVHPMHGDGTAVAMNKHHNNDPSKRFPSICFLDGDSQQKDSDESSVFRLPGEIPEATIFRDVLDKISEMSGVLSVALHQGYDKHVDLESILKTILTSNRDPHILFSQVGHRLGFIPEQTVRSAFLSTWCQAYPDEAGKIFSKIKPSLPESNLPTGAPIGKHPALFDADKVESRAAPDVKSHLNLAE